MGGQLLTVVTDTNGHMVVAAAIATAASRVQCIVAIATIATSATAAASRL